MSLRIATLFLALFLIGCDQKEEPSGKEGPTGKEEPSGQVCGGIAAVQCPTGQTCVDDPADTCDPKKGGADCSGTCQ